MKQQTGMHFSLSITYFDARIQQRAWRRKGALTKIERETETESNGKKEKRTDDCDDDDDKLQGRSFVVKQSSWNNILSQLCVSLKSEFQSS